MSIIYFRTLQDVSKALRNEKEEYQGYSQFAGAAIGRRERVRVAIGLRSLSSLVRAAKKPPLAVASNARRLV
jgi:hypothetical protein